MKRRNRFHSYRFSSLLWVLALSLVLCGCGMSEHMRPISESDEPDFRRGQEELKLDRKQEALSAFLKVLDERRDAPESHLEVGRLYLFYVGNPVLAIYHFNKYLEYKPDVEQSPMVRQLIQTAEKEFARRLPGGPFRQDVERMDVEDSFKKLKDENLELKKQLLLVRQQLAERERALSLAVTQAKERSSAPATSSIATITIKNAAGGSREVPVGKVGKITAGGKVHVVQQGETLSNISKQFYGTTARWKEIWQANTDVIPKPEMLKPGMELRIP